MYEICCMRATYFNEICCMCATLYKLDFGAVLGHVATVRDRPVDVLALSMGTIITGEHLRQYPGNKSLIRSCIMDGFVTDPSETVRILTADTRVTLKEFDCRHLQAAFTYTEEYFTAIDDFLKAH